MNKLSVSWSRYQELLAAGKVKPPLYRDDRGTVWVLEVGNPVFDTTVRQTPENKQALDRLLAMIAANAN